jgi:hypothetical protein
MGHTAASMDAAAVLSRYRDQIGRGDVAGLRDRILGDLSRQQVAITPALRTLLERPDFFTLGGFDSALRSLSSNAASSTQLGGRATTSYLSMLTQQIGAAQGNQARTAAQREVDSLLKDLIGRIEADTNGELLKTLAERAAKASRQLSCDLVNECGTRFRGSLNAIERNYSEAFTRSLQRIGIDFTGGYFAQAKIGKAGCDRLDVEIRLAPDLTAAFESEQKKRIAEASSDEVVAWFMKRKPNPAELEALALQGGPSTTAEIVREGFLRALVSNATPRYPNGDGIWTHVGHFAMQWIPRDSRDEPDPLASQIMEIAYRRIGLVPRFSRQTPYEPGKPGSLERAKLALSIRGDGELSAAFERETGKKASEATSDQIFEWFKKSEPRLDQVLRIATTDLPNDERGLARERILDLVIGQAESQSWNSTALIVLRNSVEHQRRDRVAGDLYATAFTNLSTRLLERIQAHPLLAQQIAEEKPKDVMQWFERKKPDASILIALAGI